jgi:hypothetical protein
MAGVRYDNPVGLIVGTAVLQILAALSVGLRFYTRRWKEQNIIASDWLILVAFIFGAGLTALEFYGENFSCIYVPYLAYSGLQQLRGILTDGRYCNSCASLSGRRQYRRPSFCHGSIKQNKICECQRLSEVLLCALAVLLMSCLSFYPGGTYHNSVANACDR